MEQLTADANMPDQQPGHFKNVGKINALTAFHSAEGQPVPLKGVYAPL